jgi:membrane protease subunit (stomatin/prohibitin family)
MASVSSSDADPIAAPQDPQKRFGSGFSAEQERHWAIGSHSTTGTGSVGASQAAAPRYPWLRRATGSDGDTRNLPLLRDLMNWDKAFESPFKSDVYFFSTRLQIDQRWGTATPITIRDKEYGAVRLRGYGIYAYRIADPRVFYTSVSGTRDIYRVADMEGQLRETIVARMTDTFANSQVPFLDMAANQATLAQKIADHASPAFNVLGLELNQLIVENLSLPDELQKVLDQRIGMNMVGDLGRYTQYEAAQAIPIAAANEGGAAGMGVGLGPASLWRRRWLRR